MKTLSLSTTCLLLLGVSAMSSEARAQDAKNGLTDPAPLTDIKGADLLGPDLVDFDGDGKLDIVAGNYDGNFLFFRNEGKTTAPTFASPKKLTADGKPITLNHW